MPSYSSAQEKQWNEVLGQIRQNNQKIQAFEEYVNARKLDLLSTNNLPDPQLSGFYLPFGEHDTPDYTEFQLSQSFEFPTVYSRRSDLIDLQINQLGLEYEQLQQQTLLQAKDLIQQFIYLQQLKQVEEKRMEQALKVYRQTNDLYDSEQIGILELNKSKIAWMDDQFRLEEIANQMNRLLQKLEFLNGGHKVNLSGLSYNLELAIMPFDSLWQEKLTSDPVIKSFQLEDNISAARLNLAQSQSLPELTIGFNQQGIPGAVYSGAYGGLAIPLWSNRHKVKSARAQQNFQQINTLSKTNEIFSSVKNAYDKYQLLLRKYTEYVSVLKSLQNEELLWDAYRLGEISFIDYYQELTFYREAYNKMLQLELQLHQQKAELLKHQLI